MIGTHCAVMFCMPGGAQAIMIARVRVIQKITLSMKGPHDAGGRGENAGSARRRSKPDTGASHL
jgi:hypothetical protein